MISRDDFEAWYQKRWPLRSLARWPYDGNPLGGLYINDSVQEAWDAWENALANHAKVCAGVWVPVEERLPNDDDDVAAVAFLSDEGIPQSIYMAPCAWEVWENVKHVYSPPPTHWLDVRIPSRGESDG